MTLGDGILWSTVLILLAAGMYQISIRKKWKLVGKVFGVVILIGAVIGGGVWGWFKYQGRPYIAEELAGIRFGMTQLEVQLAMGEPEISLPVRGSEDSDPELGRRYGHFWVYGGTDGVERVLTIRFYGDAPEELGAAIVCERDGFNKVLGIGRFNSEKTVIDKLGEPTSVSIDSEGLKKYISYEQWGVAYEIEQRKVRRYCIIESGPMTYYTEYGDEPEDSEE